MWTGTVGEVNQAVYVPQDRLLEPSLRWYFGVVFDEVRAVVNSVDPYGLLHAGAPDDEYEGEISNMLLSMGEALSEREAIEIMVDEFVESFGWPPRVERAVAERLGREIWQAWCLKPTK